MKPYKKEYATTSADWITDSPPVPVIPDGDGWEMCGSAATREVEPNRFGTWTTEILWFWVREVES